MKSSAKKFWLWLTLASLAGGGGYAWYARSEKANGETRYKTAAVDRGDLTQSVSANGTLNPVSVVNVGTQVSGTVRKLYVDFNDRVKQGQILLQLDDALLSAQAKQSAANVKNAEAALELARANEERIRSLFAQEYVSRQEMDSSVQSRKSAEAQLDLARAQLEKDRANLGYAVIRSPVSGVVTDRVVDIGQTVAASFQTPTLIKIAQDLSRMQIDSSFAEADIGSIRVGQAVRFNVDAFPSRAFRGTVKQIRLNPTTQQNVVTYDVVISVDNPEQTLLPGMTAYVNIVVAQRADVLRVPNAALRFKPSDQPGGGEEKRPQRKRDAASGTVYVLEKNSLRPVSVTTGISDNRNVEIVSGELKAGDRVVVTENQPGGDAQPASAVRLRMF